MNLACVGSAQQTTFLVFVENSDVDSLVLRQRAVTINLGSMNSKRVKLRDLVDLVLVVICLLLQSGITDNLSIRLRSRRDLCRRVLTGVHVCISGREPGGSLAFLGIYRAE